jgi:hypothetical protein
LSSASAVDAPKCGKAINMVGQISTILAEEGANIVDMLNKSRDEVAYTLVDIEGGVSDTVVLMTESSCPTHQFQLLVFPIL